MLPLTQLERPQACPSARSCPCCCGRHAACPVRRCRGRCRRQPSTSPPPGATRRARRSSMRSGAILEPPGVHPSRAPGSGVAQDVLASRCSARRAHGYYRTLVGGVGRWRNVAADCLRQGAAGGSSIAAAACSQAGSRLHSDSVRREPVNLSIYQCSTHAMLEAVMAVAGRVGALCRHAPCSCLGAGWCWAEGMTKLGVMARNLCTLFRWSTGLHTSVWFQLQRVCDAQVTPKPFV